MLGSLGKVGLFMGGVGLVLSSTTITVVEPLSMKFNFASNSQYVVLILDDL